MPSPEGKRIKLYDPETGKICRLENLIQKLGVRAVAEKYKVSASTVMKWRRGNHRPARRTVTRSGKSLL